MPTIVISKRDVASMNIGKYLTEHYFERTEKTFGKYYVHEYGNADMIVIDTEHIYAEWLEREYPSDIYIVASRHSSESGKPCLTVHPTGNWGNAMLGGRSRTLSIAPAQYMHAALLALFEERDSLGLEYEVSYEVTHHGPTLNTPIMFVEVGSTLENWEDKRAVEAVAEAIVRALEPKDVEVAVGFGGGHYAPRFTDIARKKGIGFGHMAPRYVEEFLDEEMVRLAVERTTPRPKYYALHGLSEEKKELVEKVMKALGLRRVK